MDLQTPVRIAEKVLFREVDGEAVLLQVGTGRYYGLDPVATRMWETLVASETVGDALRRLEEEYDVDRDLLGRDLIEFVQSLVEKGLLRLEAH